MKLERWNSEGTSLFNIKKVGLFLEKSPTFGVWLPSADGSGHWEELLSL